MSKIDNLIIARDEMRDLYNQTIAANDSITQKSSIILGVIGLVLPIATAVNIESLRNIAHSFCFWFLLIISFALFISLVIAAIIIVFPVPLHSPIQPQKEVLENEIVSQKTSLALRKIIMGYIEAINVNETKNRNKAKVLNFGLIVFPIITIFMVLLLFVP